LSARPSSVGLSLFRTTIDIDSNYYPERLGHFFVRLGVVLLPRLRCPN
jgi:hypothetical protein